MKFPIRLLNNIITLNIHRFKIINNIYLQIYIKEKKNFRMKFYKIKIERNQLFYYISERIFLTLFKP